METKTDTNTALLDFIYQNAEMGKQTIPQLLDSAEDPEFRRVLSSQLREYEDICHAAKDMLHQEETGVKGVGPMAKISSYLSVNFNLMIDKTTSHMAEMMMKGSNMGIIEITQKLKKYPDADSAVLSLGHKLLKTEERNVEQLKKFL